MYGKIKKSDLFSFASIKSSINNLGNKFAYFKERIGNRFSIKAQNSKKKVDLFKIIQFSIMSGILLLEKEKRLYCYKATNKELEKMMNNLENQIKNLEFRYHGKLRRQPIK